MPYASDRQRRYFHAAEARGDMPSSVVKEYDSASRGKTMSDRKSKIAIILAHGGPEDMGHSESRDEGTYGDDGPDEGDDDVGLEDVAKECLDAIHDRDPQAFADCIRALVHLCCEERDEDAGDGDSKKEHGY